MSVLINTRGTIHSSFKIGKTGPVLTQNGTVELPDGENFTVTASEGYGLKINSVSGAALLTTDSPSLDIVATDLMFNGVQWPGLDGGAGKVLTTDGQGGIIWSDTVYAHPIGDGNMHVPATGTTSSGKVLKAGDSEGSFAWSTLTKIDVGLDNVDNTSDADKPISTAAQAALGLKAPLNSPGLTGTPTAPTAAPGTNTAQIATTAYVQAEIANATEHAVSPASTVTLGGIKLIDDTIQTVNANSVTVRNGRTYGIQLDTAGHAVVNVPWTDTIYSHPLGDGNLHVPATGNTSNGMVLKAGNTDGSIAWATLTRTDVGLGNVDNTRDADKPISTATQTALNAKQDKLVSGTSIKTINGASILGNGDITAGDVTLTGIQTLTNKTLNGSVLTGTVEVTGSYSSNVVSMVSTNINCSLGNYFTASINGSITFTVSNVPSNMAYSFVLEVTHVSGNITWFSGVQWPRATPPDLIAGNTHLFVFVTDNGGVQWRGAALPNYAN